MWFWWFIFCCDILIPVIMIVCGWMMRKHCPKNINRLMGYRTTRSMRNMDTLNFAHEYCGKLWWKIGWGILIPSIIIHIPFYKAEDNTIGAVSGILAAIQIIILTASTFPTEIALKRTFTDDGIRR